MNKEFEKALELIKNAKNILITTHTNPDGDALGSICALSHFLEHQNKRYTAVVHMIPDTYEFLPGINLLTTLNDYQDSVDDYDLVITVDFNTFDRAPIEETLNKAYKNNIPFINIDHHQSNALFGAANLVNESASSTTEIIFKFLIHNHININDMMATCLLTGIFTDTGNLSNSATTVDSMKIASQLLLMGAHAYKINQNITSNKNLNVMNLWGIALSRLQYNKTYGIAYTVITQHDLAVFNVPSEAIEGLPNFLNNLDGAKAVLVLKEDSNGIIRGSWRTTKDNIDVSILAGAFGGGGHKKAAGFSVKGELKQTKRGWKII